MSNSPKHRIFKLPVAAVLKVLAENGAEKVAPNPHTQTAKRKQSRWLTFEELETLKGIRYTRRHIDRLEKAGKFPKRIKSGARIYWWEHEIDEWKQSEAAAR